VEACRFFPSGTNDATNIVYIRHGGETPLVMDPLKPVAILVQIELETTSQNALPCSHGFAARSNAEKISCANHL